MTKFLNYNLRSIYAFHLPPPPPSIEEEVPLVTPPTASDKVSLRRLLLDASQLFISSVFGYLVEIHV